MFISSDIFILLAIIFLTIIGFLIFSRRSLTRFGRLPGDIRYEGQRTRVRAPLLASMLLPSLVLSLALCLLGAIF